MWSVTPMTFKTHVSIFELRGSVNEPSLPAGRGVFTSEPSGHSQVLFPLLFGLLSH